MIAGCLGGGAMGAARGGCGTGGCAATMPGKITTK